MDLLLLLITSLLVGASVPQIAAVEYAVTSNAAGTPGGIRFDSEIGTDYSRSILEKASAFNWEIFGQGPDERKAVQRLSMVVENFDDPNSLAYSSNDLIHVNAKYIAGFSGEVQREITGILYHEVTHTWQWDGAGQAPRSLIDGVADYVRLKAGFVPSYFTAPGGGERWDQSYSVTARFLEYCNSLREGFVADLNRKLRSGYSESFFVELLGKSPTELWSDYKARYGG